MSLICISHLCFSYPGSAETIFENLNLQLDTDWKLGLTGRNGRGKTTLLRLLLGEYSFQGSIRAAVDFAYFPYAVAKPELTLAAIAAQSRHPSWALERELSLLGMPLETADQAFNTLSKGEQTKALLSLLFLGEDRFLLIDEPTNHLDLAGRQAVSAYLKGKRGFILVSHDRVFLDGCVNHILAINKSSVELRKGDYSTWQAERDAQDRAEAAENARLKKEISRLSTAAGRSAAWADRVEDTKYGSKNSGLRPDRGYVGAKSAKMMKRKKAIEDRRQKAVEEKAGLLQDQERMEALKLSPLLYHSERLVSIAGFSLRYENRTVLEDLTLSLPRGERVALCGKNGCGKSSVLKSILGEPIPYTGTLSKGSGLVISYVSQSTAHLQGSLRDYATEKGIDLGLFLAILHKLGFAAPRPSLKLASLSEGQKKKVLIAGSLCESAHLYIWDEPLNYVDIPSRIQIEALLREYKLSLLFVEHDAAFIKNVATNVVYL